MYHSRKVSPKGLARYHEKDEYSENPGHWLGKGSKALQLKNPVTEKTLRQIAFGKAPNGIQIKAKRSKKLNGKIISAHIAGTVVTFSMDKSWSIIGLVGGDKRVIEAFKHSCLETVEEIERTCIEAQVRTGGKRRKEITGNMIAATFDHQTSRPTKNNPPMPLIHKHVIVFSSTRCSDGKWRSLENKQFFYKQKPRLVEFFANRFLERVQGLGYETEWNDDHKTFRCKQISREQIEAFSPRSQQVKQEIEQLSESSLHPFRNGKASNSQYRFAALKGRAKKWDVSIDELRPIWSDLAMELEIDFERIPGFVRTPEKAGPEIAELIELAKAELEKIGQQGNLTEKYQLDHSQIGRQQAENSCSMRPREVSLDAITDAEAMEFIRPPHIIEKHWEELVIESGIHPAIASETFRSVDGREAEKLMLSAKIDRTRKYGGTYVAKQIRKIKAQWKHLTNGGLWCEGTDGWGQLKPATPRIRDGKPVKYESQPGVSLGVILPKGPDIDWEKIKDDTTIEIGITEGGKKAASAITYGLPTIGLAGLNGGLLKTQLRDPLKEFDWQGRKVKLIFDKDPSHKLKTLQNGAREVYKLGAVLEFYGADVEIGTIPGKLKEKVGLDDFLVADRTFDEIKFQTVEEFAKKSPYLAKKWKTHNIKRVKHRLNLSDLQAGKPAKSKKVSIQKTRPKAQNIEPTKPGQTKYGEKGR